MMQNNTFDIFNAFSKCEMYVTNKAFLYNTAFTIFYGY